MMVHSKKSARLRTAALAISLCAPVVLSACAEDSARSGSSVNADTKSDLVGGGGQVDEIYRQIYSPGNPRWSDF